MTVEAEAQTQEQEQTQGYDAPKVMAGDKCACKRCGYRWMARNDNPRRCPRCSAYNWHRAARPGNYRRAKPVMRRVRPDRAGEILEGLEAGDE